MKEDANKSNETFCYVTSTKHSSNVADARDCNWHVYVPKIMWDTSLIIFGGGSSSDERFVSPASIRHFVRL